MAVPPIALPTAVASRYAIERELGRGATSIVYLARDLAQSRMVAIKMLRPELAESAGAEHFLREIRRTTQLQDPHIVPVLDFGEANGTLYYVLPVMEGGTLRDRLRHEQQLPLKDVVAIGRTIATALDVAHARGLIHRDVKPENILFTSGEACLADFGIARALAPVSGEFSTSTGVVRGTPAYMSPEQASGEREYDGRSDIYSLACVLYEAIAGVAAFVGTSQSVVAQRLVHMPRPLSVYRPTVAPELQQVLERALAIAPADRYQTAGEFADALAALEPVLAQPSRKVPAGTMAALWLRAHRWSVAAGLIGVVAIGAASVWVRAGAHAADRCAPEGTVDPFRVVLFPFADPAGPPSSVNGQLVTRMVRAAAAHRWSNVALIAEDQLPPVAAEASLRAFACTAQRRGAARLVLGNLTTVGDSLLVRAMIYDARGDLSAPLEHQLMIAQSEARSARTFEPLALALLRPSREPAAAWYADTLTTDYSTWQEFARARVLIDSGVVDSAHTVLLRIHNREPSFGPAIAWLAQTDAWLAPRRSAEWTPLAHRALDHASDLSLRDRLVARALAALGDSRFDDGCRDYDRLIAADSTDFVAWIGAGDCRRLDSVVVRDPQSPSGWAFRSEGAEAVARYERAAELCPGEFMGTVITALALSAEVVPQIRNGWTPGSGDRATFGAMAGFERGRIVHIPIPFADIQTSSAGAVPITLGDALNEGRRVLLRASDTWVRRFPRNADAHAARGRALELQGILLPGKRASLSADDELLTAMRLTLVPARRLELAVDRLRVRVKAADYEGANVMADSILGRSSANVGADWLLAGVAVLVGRSRQASEYVESEFRREMTDQPSREAVPSEALAHAATFRVLAAMGVCGDTLQRLENRVGEILSSSVRDQDAKEFRENFISKGLSLSASCDAFRPALRAPSRSDALVRIQQAMASNHAAEARAILDTLDRQRRAVPRSEVSLDYTVQEALVRAAAGDTTRAIADLAASLEALSRSATFRLQGADEPAAVGRLLALLARFTKSRDPRAFAHWRTQARQLLRGADQIVLTHAF